MKFDPITKEIYTDKGEFVKRMNCPFKVIWDDLEEINRSTLRKCSNCNRTIIDTEYLSDEGLLKMIGQNPDTCLKIDLNQHNIKLISNGFLGER